VSTARLLLLGLCCGLGIAGAACGPAAPSGPSLLLLTLDTTNPEALGCYGGPTGLTPHLDRLAAEGLVFEDARAVAPLTLPAHTSILTGLYPPRSGVRRNGETRLPEEAHTLAERASEAGYRCAAMVAAVVLAPEVGLSQGFQTYSAPATPENVEEHLEASLGAQRIADQALAWLAQGDPRQPFFLWLHFYDPHFPYEPPAGFLERAGGDPYLGEVAAMDAAIGRVLAELERTGRYESTLIVALADHGEGRGRHGEETHGAFVFDSTLRIPFLVRLPGAKSAGERIHAPVSQVDVVPLVCAVLGLPLEPGLDGRDPTRADAGPGAYLESYFGTKSFGWGPVAGWTDGRWKYLHSSAPELFDLEHDPGETRSVLSTHPDEARALRARIAELCTRTRLPRAFPEGEQGALQREIERLGYAGAGDGAELPDPEPLEPGPGPAPHTMIAAYADYMEGRKIHEEGGDGAQALALLQRAVDVNPENHKAWFTLGLVAQGQQDFARAAEAFRRAAAVAGGERIPAQLNLAVSLYNLGRTEEALRTLEVALADTPGPPGALELLVQLLEKSGRTQEAREARARLAARDAR